MLGIDACLLTKSLNIVNIPMPKDTPTNATSTKLKNWEKRVDEYVKRGTQLCDNLESALSLNWGKCTCIMRQRLEGHNNFEQVSGNRCNTATQND